MVGFRDFKEKEGNSQEDEQSKYLVKECLSCCAETMGQIGPPELPLVYQTQPILFVLLSGDGSLSGPGPLSKSF